MSVHISAKKGEVAKTVLLPGDPLRAKFIAENFLTEIHCYNEVRNMLGYTGLYRGEKVSVQGTGMGCPSIAIYAHELMHGYDVQNLIRIGTCGSYHKDVPVRSIIFAASASFTSSIPERVFPLSHIHYAPTASYDLLSHFVKVAQQKELSYHVGSVLSSDLFYDAKTAKEDLTACAQFGLLAVEMEAAALYAVAAAAGRKALAILTVSDNLVTGEQTSSEEREKTFTEMMSIALEGASHLA